MSEPELSNREMDAWLAEHGMGFPLTWIESAVFSTPAYSSDPGASDALLGEMRRRGYVFSLTVYVQGHSVARFCRHGVDVMQQDANKLRAIAAAAKKALEGR